jgi:hypothetical protein
VAETKIGARLSDSAKISSMLDELLDSDFSSLSDVDLRLLDLVSRRTADERGLRPNAQADFVKLYTRLKGTPK